MGQRWKPMSQQKWSAKRLEGAARGPVDEGPPKSRWWWVWRGLIVLGCLLILLVLLLPTLASISPVRSFVLGKVNKSLAGHVAIDDWDLGWLTGLEIHGIKVTDDAGQRVVEIKHVSSGLSLFRAIFGHISLGDTTVQGIKIAIRIDKNGDANYLHIAKASPPTPKTTHVPEKNSSPISLPAISGNISVQADGIIQYQDMSPITIDALNVKLKGTDINSAWALATDLQYHIGDSSPGDISLKGTAKFARNGVFDPQALLVDETLVLHGVDLAAAGPVLKAIDPTSQIAGTVDGQLLIKAKGTTSAGVAGEIDVDHPVFGGTALQGDTFRADSITMPVDLDVSLDKVTEIRINALGFKSPDFGLDITGDLTREAVMAMIANVPPPQDGSLTITASVRDVGAIGNQFPHMLRILPGVKFTGGSITHQTRISWTNGVSTVESQTGVQLAAMSHGKAISLAQPIELNLNTSVNPGASVADQLKGLSLKMSSDFATIDASADSLDSLRLNADFDLNKLAKEMSQFVDLGTIELAGTGAVRWNSSGNALQATGPLNEKIDVTISRLRVSGLPGIGRVEEPELSLHAAALIDRSQPSPMDQLRQIEVALRSSALRFDLHGPTLAALDCSGNIDLGTLRRQLGPTFAAKYPQLAGQIRLHGSTRGNLGEPIHGQIGVTLANVRVPRVQRLLPTLDIRAAGTFHPALGVQPASVEGLGVNVTLGSAMQPLFDLAASADLNLGTMDVPRFDLIKCQLPDLAALAEQFGEEDAPATLAGMRVGGGELNATVAGSYSSGALHLARPFMLNINHLAIAAPNGKDVVKDEAISLAIDAEMSRHEDATQVQLGRFDLNSSSQLINISLADERPILFSATRGHRPQASGAIGIQSDVSRLADIAGLGSLIGPGAQLQWRIDLDDAPGAGIAAKSDLHLLHLTVLPFLNNADLSVQTETSLADDMGSAALAMHITTPLGKIDITNASADLSAASSAEMLSAAHLAIDLPDLPRAAALAGNSGIALRSGSAAVELDISRSGSSTTLNLQSLKLSNLDLRSNQQQLFAGDAEVKAQASMEMRDGRIAALRLSDLNTSLDIVDLSLSDPIVISDPLGTPRVRGGIHVRGDLAKILALAGPANPSTPQIAGTFDVAEEIQGTPQNMRLVGDVALDNLVVQRGPDTLLQEDKVQINHDVQIDQAQKTIALSPVKISFSSGMAGITAAGRLVDYTGQKTLDGVHIQLDYDLAKLLAKAQPFLTPAQRKQFAMLVLAGHSQRNFDISGQLGGAGSPLMNLGIDGSVVIADLKYPPYEITDFELPISLHGGRVMTAYVKDGATTLAPPAHFNSGQFDVGGIAYNLADSRITVPPNKAIFSNVQLSAPVASDLLGKSIPLFADTKDASGTLTFTIVDCNNVSVADLLNPSPPRPARLEISFSVANLHVVSGLTQIMLSFSDPSSFDGSAGSIQNAHAVVQNGLATEDVLVTLSKGFQIGLKGTVRLSDEKFMPMVASISKGMFSMLKTADASTFDGLPDMIDIPIEGTANAPKPQLGQLTSTMAKAKLKGSLGNLPMKMP